MPGDMSARFCLERQAEVSRPFRLAASAEGCALGRKAMNATPRRPEYAEGVAKALTPEVLDQLRVQERFDCWNRDEFELMEEMYAEDAVYDVSAVFTDVAPLRGKDEIRRYWHELRETWSGLRLDPVEVLDLGGVSDVAELRLWGKGNRSGVEVEQRLANLYTFDPAIGRATHIQLLPDLAAALSIAESYAPSDRLTFQVGRE